MFKSLPGICLIYTEMWILKMTNLNWGQWQWRILATWIIQMKTWAWGRETAMIMPHKKRTKLHWEACGRVFDDDYRLTHYHRYHLDISNQNKVMRYKVANAPDKPFEAAAQKGLYPKGEARLLQGDPAQFVLALHTLPSSSVQHCSGANLCKQPCHSGNVCFH